MVLIVILAFVSSITAAFLIITLTGCCSEFFMFGSLIGMFVILILAVAIDRVYKTLLARNIELLPLR
jgi:hypothetical protein